MGLYCLLDHEGLQVVPLCDRGVALAVGWDSGPLAIMGTRRPPSRILALPPVSGALLAPPPLSEVKKI